MRYRKAALAAALTVLVLAVYGRTGSWPFVNLDDPQFVYRNPLVLGGLTWEGAARAFTTVHVSAWHPLTWLSHMADVSLFGTDAGRHHLVNVALHGACTVLLFLGLSEMTGRPWRSAFAAALFAVHPLHVETVAWVSERKELLCTLFTFLAIGGYARYARSPSAGRYLLVVLPFACALLSKPMAVTLPLLLVLLDAWPLDRFGAEGLTARGVARLLPEKVPLLLLSAASAAVTLAAAKGGALLPADAIPLADRASLALVSYGAYLVQAVVPARLSVIYPHPAFLGESVPPWKWAGGLALLSALSFAAWRLRGRRYLPAGWLWFLVTLLPVIGLVQAGEAARADRYTYVPLVGIFVAVAWGAAELAEGRRRVLAVLAAASIAAYSAAATAQVAVWRDSVSLFRHAAEVTQGNYRAWFNLGMAQMSRGRYDEAFEAFRRSLEIRPDYAFPRAGMGVALARLGRYGESAASFREALRLAPEDGDAWAGLGASLGSLGRYGEALDALGRAVSLKPDDFFAWNGIGLVRRDLGDDRGALAAFGEALRAFPGYEQALANAGEAHLRLGERAEALEMARRLDRVDPALAARLRGKAGGG